MRHQNPPFIPFEQNIMPPTFYTKKCTQKIPLSERLALFYSKTGFGDYHYLYWFDNYNLQHIINSKWYFENKVQRNNSTLPNIVIFYTDILKRNVGLSLLLLWFVMFLKKIQNVLTFDHIQSYFLKWYLRQNYVKYHVNTSW